MSRIDRQQVVAREPLAGDLAVQRGDRGRRLGVLDLRSWPRPRPGARRPPRSGPARSGADDAFVVDDVEHRAMVCPLACTVTLASAWKPAARTTGQSRCR
jgi:hypothetical protein